MVSWKSSRSPSRMSSSWSRNSVAARRSGPPRDVAAWRACRSVVEMLVGIGIAWVTRDFVHGNVTGTARPQCISALRRSLQTSRRLWVPSSRRVRSASCRQRSRAASRLIMAVSMASWAWARRLSRESCSSVGAGTIMFFEIQASSKTKGRSRWKPGNDVARLGGRGADHARHVRGSESVGEVERVVLLPFPVHVEVHLVVVEAGVLGVLVASVHADPDGEDVAGSEELGDGSPFLLDAAGTDVARGRDR